MHINHDPAEMLRICNRHKARTLGKLEELNCPDGFREIVRNGFGYMRNDIVEQCIQSQKHHNPQHHQHGS